MTETFHEIARSFRVADALDIAVATGLFAAVLLWIRNRSAHALLLTVIAGAALYLLSDWLRMYLTLAMFRWGLTLALFGLIVIFHNDLRQGFERLAAWHPFSQKPPDGPREPLTGTLVEAATLLAEEGTGALIVLPGRQSLKRHLRGGIPLSGWVSVPLLHSLFDDKSQGHDGAVVLKGKQVEQFGVHLPLSENFTVLGTGGTRHAAALGLAEQSDALAIVVSEERRTVSIAHRGQLREMPSAQALAEHLDQFQSGTLHKKTGVERIRWIVGTGLLLLLSVVLASFCWLLVAYQIEPVQRVVDQIPIEIQNAPAGWVIDSITPEQVQIQISGSERAFKAFDWSGLKANLDLSDVTQGRQSLFLDDDAISLPAEMSITAIEPNVVHVTAYRTEMVELPVEVKTRGELPDGYKLDGIRASIETVTVKVSTSRAGSIKSIPTEPVDLANLNSSKSLKIPLKLPQGVWPGPETPGTINVEIEISGPSEAP